MKSDPLGLFDYAAVLWRRRWVVLILAVVTPLAAASQPATWQREYHTRAVYALTPPTFAERVDLLLAWRVLPDGVLAEGVEPRLVRKQHLVDLTTRGAMEDAVLASDANLTVWLNGQRRPPTLIPEPWKPKPLRVASPPQKPQKPQKPPKPWKAPRPSAEEIAGWRTQLRAIEERLAGLSPTASSYWTSRALGLYAKLDAALVPAPPELPEPPEPPEPPPPPPEEPDETPPPRYTEGDEVRLLKAWPVTVSRRPWLYILGVAALAGLIVGVCLALVAEWYGLERARRRGIARPAADLDPYVTPTSALDTGRVTPTGSGWIP